MTALHTLHAFHTFHTFDTSRAAFSATTAGSFRIARMHVFVASQTR